MDEQGFRLWGMPWTATTISGKLPAYIHPSDSDRVRSASPQAELLTCPERAVELR
jgi:hypothetical protein